MTRTVAVVPVTVVLDCTTAAEAADALYAILTTQCEIYSPGSSLIDWGAPEGFESVVRFKEVDDDFTTHDMVGGGWDAAAEGGG